MGRLGHCQRISHPKGSGLRQRAPQGCTSWVRQTMSMGVGSEGVTSSRWALEGQPVARGAARGPEKP